MTKKTKTKRVRSELVKIQQLSDQIKSLKMKKPTPFRDTGGIAGNAIGSMFGNAQFGKNIGKWLGTGIGSLFGSGDYQSLGPIPSYNVLTSSKQIPQFVTTQSTNIVCNREYIGLIRGTSAFNNTIYPLNPGIAKTFPWLATLAQNYQEYRFHGVIFEFRPLITDFVTNGAPGVVIMATNYNADATAYTTKQQMENSEFAVSVKPTLSLIHGIECETQQTILPHRYVRSGAVPANQDLRLYDHGNFQFATQSNPIQDLGELWVSYCVEFLKPQIPATLGGNVDSLHFQQSGVSASFPLGTTNLKTLGTIVPISIGPASFTFSCGPLEKFLVVYNWSSAVAAVTLPSITTTGTILTYFNGGFTPIPGSPPPGTSASTMIETLVVQSLNAEGTITITCSLTGVFGSSCNVDVFVTQLDNTINN